MALLSSKIMLLFDRRLFFAQIVVLRDIAIACERAVCISLITRQWRSCSKLVDFPPGRGQFGHALKLFGFRAF